MNFIIKLLGLKPRRRDPVFTGRCSLCGNDISSSHPISQYAECKRCFNEMNKFDQELIEKHEKMRQAAAKTPLEFDKTPSEKMGS